MCKVLRDGLPLYFTTAFSILCFLTLVLATRMVLSYILSKETEEIPSLAPSPDSNLGYYPVSQHYLFSSGVIRLKIFHFSFCYRLISLGRVEDLISV